jgi:hypothetical protein
MATPSIRRGHGDRILEKKGNRVRRTHSVTHWQVEYAVPDMDPYR